MNHSITITLPYLPPASYSANSRVHWSAKRGKRGANHDVLDDVRMLLAEQRQSGLAPPIDGNNCWHKVHIKVIFGLPDKRRRDPGGLQERMKPMYDALVACAVMQDDDLRVIGWPEYSHHYSPKQTSTTIRIEEVLE